MIKSYVEKKFMPCLKLKNDNWHRKMLTVKTTGACIGVLYGQRRLKHGFYPNIKPVTLLLILQRHI